MAEQKEIAFVREGFFGDRSFLLDRIQIWRVNLDFQAPQLHVFWETLTDDEKKRANAYFSMQDRNQFILCRGFLRSRLGSILDCPPQIIRFTYTRYNQPELDYPVHTKINFNLAHSSGKALFAFTANRQIGIDLEKKREDIEPLELARRLFSQYEYESLRALPPDQLIRCFFKCWTRKEAFVKACGEGLSVPFDQFDVNISLYEEPKILATRGNLEPADQWNLVDIEVGSGFESALAVFGPLPELQFFDVYDLMPGNLTEATSEVKM